MRKNYAHLTFVLDNSGSMQHLKPKTLEGFNGFLRKQKALPGKLTTSLYQFTDVWAHGFGHIITSESLANIPVTVKETYNFVDVQQVPELTDENYSCDTNTPLLDAIGWAIDKTGEQLAALKEDDRPESVTLVILTDGQENHSYRYTKKQVFDKIKHQTENYKWDVIYLASGQDAIAVGASFGISAASSMNYAANPASLTASYNALGATLRSKRADANFVASFDEDQRRTVLSGEEEEK